MDTKQVYVWAGVAARVRGLRGWGWRAEGLRGEGAGIHAALGVTVVQTDSSTARGKGGEGRGGEGREGEERGG